ncbi:hypothetical protein NliqN6_6002 [Naganishia liquefaciens]|uniref:Transmembrane protein 188 n=1 Tax=Naganishia liquefaciens TaxID=104408 RepID=A0A8H3TYM3_9TREE|nr:hypothetical protein NliqN6_6002 [Naganishia liquefaciens]
MPRSQRPPTAPFHPSSDTTTYKDLLLFEERLKMNARMLKRRKRRYEAFLIVLIGAIVFLANKIVFGTFELPLSRYFSQALLAVALVTLVLFFASGMYQERIGYANQYVPHANRSLRSLNMHLNMRRPPRSIKSLLSYIPFLNIKPATVRRNASPPPSTTSSTTLSPPGSPATTPVALIPPIPPTVNPRGELIFSSRVDKTFKEGYERYRAAFERRRAEKLAEARWNARWGWTRRFGRVPGMKVAAPGPRKRAPSASPDRRGDKVAS